MCNYTIEDFDKPKFLVGCLYNGGLSKFSTITPILTHLTAHPSSYIYWL